MLADFGAVAIGISLILGAPWIAREGDRSSLSHTFFLRIFWNMATNVWWVRWLGVCCVSLGVWQLLAS